MKWNEVFCNTFKSIGREIGLDVQMVEGYLTCTPLDPDDPRYSTDLILPSMKMVEACRAEAFDFFQPCLEAGLLTEQQMHRACRRYHLGKTRSGQPMFWMIDDMLNPQDAHIGSSDVWLSSLLKQRTPILSFWRPVHCLFGLHLVNHGDCPRDSHRRNTAKSICVVESEASAVVLSELFPDSIWLSYATTPHLTPDLFAPLEGRTVTLYPRTDPTLSTYLFFEDLADLTRRQYDIHLTVDTTLEDHATAAQKEQCIDILDFILSSNK